MKMGKLEKRFINNAAHSQSVVQHTEGMMRHISTQPGQTYLDVGCGNGAAAIYVAQTYGLNVTGVDVDAEQIALAQTAVSGTTQTRFIQIDGRQLSFEEGEFDIVFSNKVTHHIPNWLDALAEMVRVLKQGGYLLYSDLVLPAPLARLGKAAAGRWFGFPSHQAIGLFVERCGLTAVYQSLRPYHFSGVFRK